MTGVWQSHEAFERERPGEREYADTLEQHRQAAHIARHGTLDGYTAPREFPCPGWLRETGRIGAVIEAVCDACEFVTTVREATATTGGEW